jgi:hypothetical protein
MSVIKWKVAMGWRGGIALSILLAAAPCWAAGGEIEQLIGRGIELRKQRRDVDALKLFEQAYSRGGSAWARVQMGLAE